MSGESLDAQVVVDRGGFRLEAHVRADAGDVVALMGPSGAGKSTLLGVLAGLVGLDEGRVSVADRVLDAASPRRVHISPAERRVVLLGQDARLFPHLTAQANIAFGVRVHGASASAAFRAADEWLRRVGLDGLGARRPAELSGGQQQRVALARALATDPAVLLLDEPLTSLDPETAGDIRALLREQLAATRTTAIVATHDAVDAVALASRLVVLEGGRVTQEGDVRSVFAAPATRFAAAVAGVNRIDGVVRDGAWSSGAAVVAASGIPDGRAAAVFRPADVRFLPVGARASGPTAEWIARITRLEQTPGGVRVQTADPDVSIDVPVETAFGLVAGDALTLSIDPAAVRFVPLA
ncbi:sulfate/molybdate ABC transporter ATP-binding protein [Microbacterium sp. SLBN-146]|uniref:sulfate/molybdate ABC transporter ATP-binding protein n=1 Tax=Microbacterium sp. SLBN-146 TaxID=2768457 RepID=UPI00117416C6|nr:ATP-binding cassette domain-containing protein [Microbacterium sp. SLBN-146]TQJ31246.1 molybdate transport system ATP-binding protein [Microbacterium sp. SLBN-146]